MPKQLRAHSDRFAALAAVVWREEAQERAAGSQSAAEQPQRTVDNSCRCSAVVAVAHAEIVMLSSAPS